MQRLQEKHNEARVKMAKDLKAKNVNAMPYIEKIMVNAGLGDMNKDKELKNQAIENLSTITGQQPAVQLARVSVASFSLRRGMPVGLKVTLRRNRMFAFLDRFITIVLPRLRDFKGISTKSFDKAGNCTIGLSEQTVFPEIDMSKSPKPFGLEITIVVRNSDPKLSKKFLSVIGVPFKKEE